MERAPFWDEHARHWHVAEVQEALRVVLTCMESAVFGPLMGFGCPDRAALIVGQWAKTDVISRLTAQWRRSRSRWY